MGKTANPRFTNLSQRNNRAARRSAAQHSPSHCDEISPFPGRGAAWRPDARRFGQSYLWLPPAPGLLAHLSGPPAMWGPRKMGNEALLSDHPNRDSFRIKVTVRAIGSTKPPTHVDKRSCLPLPESSGLHACASTHEHTRAHTHTQRVLLVTGRAAQSCLLRPTPRAYVPFSVSPDVREARLPCHPLRCSFP